VRLGEAAAHPPLLPDVVNDDGHDEQDARDDEPELQRTHSMLLPASPSTRRRAIVVGARERTLRKSLPSAIRERRIRHPAREVLCISVRV
jgi:hypothetical protein